jgi:multiple sugar transport system permease protein
LRPVTIFVLTITILASANVFGQPYLITQGQPGGETRSVIMQIGEEGLRRFNMGSASAMSTVLTLALLIVSAICLSFLRERTPKEQKR